MINEPLHLICVNEESYWIGNIIRIYHDTGVRILRATSLKEYNTFIKNGTPCNYHNIKCCPHTRIKIIKTI